MLRAGPFSDERVVGLARRRFVCHYFDLDTGGAAGDADARRFVVLRRKELGGRSVPTPPVLLMTTDGQVVGEASNYADAETLLAAMQRALADHPELSRPSPEEEAAETPLERARIAFDLGRLDEAARLLEGQASDAARYLRGHVARWRGDDRAMEAAFEGLRGEWADDVRIERAHRLWAKGEFEALRAALEDFPAGSDRASEASYHLGLALFHLGRRDEALALWKDTIEGCSEDPWIYRADWAYCGVVEGNQRGFSTLGRRSSVLGRIGYMGRRNPDLDGPPTPK